MDGETEKEKERIRKELDEYFSNSGDKSPNFFSSMGKYIFYKFECRNLEGLYREMKKRIEDNPKKYFFMFREFGVFIQTFSFHKKNITNFPENLSEEIYIYPQGINLFRMAGGTEDKKNYMIILVDKEKTVVEKITKELQRNGIYHVIVFGTVVEKVEYEMKIYLEKFLEINEDKEKDFNEICYIVSEDFFVKDKINADFFSKKLVNKDIFFYRQIPLSSF